MKILVMNHWNAEKHLPTRPTYLIRVYGENDVDPRLYPIRQSEHYRTHEYCFDDTTPETRGISRPLDDNIAKKILEDFAQGKDSCEELLVHCMMGRSRSPAIAIALNEIFLLGQDSKRLKFQFHQYNRWVYSLLKDTANSFQ